MKNVIKTIILVGAVLGFGVVGYANAGTVTEASKLTVCSFSKSGCDTTDSTTIYVANGGEYAVTAEVERGTHNSECQPNEDFYLHLNGRHYITNNDNNPCEPGTHNVTTWYRLPNVTLAPGNNDLRMIHADQYSINDSRTKTEGANSVAVTIRVAPVANPVDGKCGSTDGITVDSRPTTGLCSTGNASSVTGSGPWSWTCYGIDGGKNDTTCFAHKTFVPGACGPADGQTLDSKPTTGLCSVGSSTGITFQNNTWGWSCETDDGFESCSAVKRIVLPVCGSTNGQTVNQEPTTGLCSTGRPSIVGGSGPWTWQCANDGRVVNCRANVTAPDCGPTAGQTVDSKPTTGLCSNGARPSNVGGSGPWTWSCTNGSSVVECNANITPPTCGDADDTTVDTKPTTGLCSIGRPSIVGGSGPWTWQCANGTLTVDCDANITGGPNCGSSDGGVFDTRPTTGLCSTGNASSVAGSGPWTWTCAVGDRVVDCDAGKTPVTPDPEPEPEPEPEEEDEDGAIGNLVWHDRNGNCIQDEGEEGITGVTLKLYHGNDKDTDRTNSRGRYKFKDLDEGGYKVVVAQETLPAGCYQVCDPDGKMDGKTKVDIDGDEYYRKADFGYKCEASAPVATSPETGAGAVAGIVSTIVAGLSAGYVYRRKA